MLTHRTLSLQSEIVDPRPWSVAWQDALYAAGRGFYVTRGGPSAHFTTAAHGPTGPVLADVLLRLWHRSHDEPPAVVVDIGAGRGELTTHLLHQLTESTGSAQKLCSRSGEGASASTGSAQKLCSRSGEGASASTGSAQEWRERARAQEARRSCALDQGRERPRAQSRAQLRRLSWPPDSSRSTSSNDRTTSTAGSSGSAPPEAPRSPPVSGRLEHALVIAHEWLDVVPCTIAEVDDRGVLREVLVAAGGAESLGGRVEGADRQWAEKHWPTRDPGDRVEIGRTRDDAWANLLTRVRSGLVVAVDYGHTLAERPREGTLTAYGRGRRAAPVPDGTCDLTAHVAIDTLAKAEVHRQRDLLRDLGVRGATPDVRAAATDPRGYLAALERAAAESQLIARGGFGDFWWAVRHV